MKVLGILVLLFSLGTCTFFAPNLYEHFGKRYANADREIFEKNKSYIHGKIENLQRLKFEYELANDEDHKKAIRRMILVEASTIMKADLPYELAVFIGSLSD